MSGASSERISIFVVMHPREGREAELREALLALVEPTRAEAGCIAYDVYGTDDETLVLFETWSNQTKLAAHQQQPAIKEFFGSRVAELLREDLSAHFTSLLTPVPERGSQHQ